MPDRLIIGTEKAFENGYAYSYTKNVVGSEVIYVCEKGSEWARRGEVLVLRYIDSTWTAFDTALNANGSTLQCCQPVFRCSAEDITEPGWHRWEINCEASRYDVNYAVVDWQGELWAETRLR